MSYRFRLEGALLVLQVEVPGKYSPYDRGRESTWRDASVSDIPLADVFDTSPRERDKQPAYEYSGGMPSVLCRGEG